MKKKNVANCFVETDFTVSPGFFEKYLTDSKWVDSNILYGKRIPEITDNKPMEKHFIKHIENYDFNLKKFVVKIFKEFGIQSRDFRCDFFLVKAGGKMPFHIDSQSFVAILLPLSPNTGALVCQSGQEEIRMTYQNLILLNTQIPHSVEPPTEDRLLFRIGVHDFRFEQLDLT